MKESTRVITRFGLLTALALVLGLLDRAVPLSAVLGGAIPGIRLGLANTVLLFAVFTMSVPACVLLMLVKVLLSGFLFGSLSAILYSAAGGIFSLLAMLPLSRILLSAGVKKAMVPAVSIAGAMAHNLGQVLAAVWVLRTPALLGTYLPVLLGVGAVVGCLTGIITDRVGRILHLSTAPSANGRHRSN